MAVDGDVSRGLQGIEHALASVFWSRSEVEVLAQSF